MILAAALRADVLGALFVLLFSSAACSSKSVNQGDGGQGTGAQGSGGVAGAVGVGGAACAGNLVQNADFEKGAYGWFAAFATLDQVPGGHAESAFAGLVKSIVPPSEEYFSLDDTEPSVLSTTQGDRYRLQAWARSDTTTQSLHATLRETNGTGVYQNSTGFVTLDSEWKSVATEYVITLSGAVTLEVFFAVPQPIQDASFLVDDICLVRTN